MTSHGEGQDFLTRMYLRHYAFLRRLYPQLAAENIYHFATLGVSGVISCALLALTAAGCLAVSGLLARPIVPWSLPNWAVMVACAAIVFVPGWLIDTRFKNLTDVQPETVELYSSSANRRQWWLMVVSIVPMCGTVAVCFAILRDWQQ